MKKQNQILYSMANNTVSHKEMIKIKNIRAKSSKYY